jgi:pyruvate/2-oxoglutarate dehydrogenase complex dihydrolipoamide dehydrogenase (E3) component
MIKGLSSVPYLTNESLFNLTTLPKVLAIIGAGAVACEMAQAFARFGSEVFIFARSSSIMSREDPEAVLVLEASFLEVRDV